MTLALLLASLTPVADTFLQPGEVMWREVIVIMIVFAAVLLVRPRDRE